METCCSNDGRKATIETKPICSEGSDSGSQAQNGETAGQLAEQTDVPALPPDQPLPGKQKKTSFKFFGVRKSICTLPNFFSGRTKSLGKGASKKSLSKSKTHDCISDSYGQVKRGPLENISNGETALNPHEHRGAKTLPSSQSAQMGANLDLNHPRASSWTSTEGLDSKQKEDKTLSLPKAKKGLKGLFSGMRRHKKSKAHHSDKEPLALNVLPGSVNEVNKKPRTEPAAQDINALNAMGKGKIAERIESPSKTNILSKINKHLDIDVIGKKSEFNVGAETCSVTKHSEKSLTANDSKHVKLDAVAACATSAGICPGMNSDDLDNAPVLTHSSDQINLLFEDVSSLKSFDSLTGCGDIIADQDIDSIADSTVSVERSRELTKRSSCLVTYQGGGEGMATPDELGDEYLQHLWEKAVEDGASCDLRPDESYLEVQEVSDPAVPLQREITPLCAEGGVLDTSDVLTPQSEHQGSAPNSDEGYFDSNTPGPDDDTGDSLSHDFKKDRLPRDSYSGDALYEFYEADDSLMSPPVGGKSLFKNEGYCPELFDHFLEGNFPNDINLMQIIGQQMGTTETEEERLAVIQKQILQWDQNKEPIFKKSEYANQGHCTKRNAECKNRTAALFGRKQRCLNSEQVSSPNSSQTSVNDAFSDSGTEHPTWRDFQEMSLPCLSRFYSVSSDQRTLSNGHVQITQNSCNFDLDADDVLATNGQNGSEMHLNVRKSHQGNGLSKEPNDDASPTDILDCEQAVSFSQALVDFTSNGTLFSSLSESLGSTDSGSSFTQNLTTLPTMVNFDIVDVENDGEGEFDQQIEMSAEEEINASFEDFESSFVQKESFAECDEQMFHLDPQSTLQSCTWGVSSLPRHLSLYRLGCSVPAPLSLNRRSRSLDTESLEFELASLRLSKSGLRSCELPVKRDGIKDALLSELRSSRERAPPFYAEGGEAAAKWLKSLHCNDDLSPEAEERWDLVGNGGTSAWGSDVHTSVPRESDPQRADKRVFQGRPENRGASNQSPSQMVRPSMLPLLRSAGQSPEVSGSYQYYADHIHKKLDLGLHWEEQKGDCASRFCFPQSSEKVTKCKPIGITQGMPQFIPNDTETLKHSANYAERYESPQKNIQKGRVEQVQPMPARWTNDCGEYPTNQMLSFTFGSAGV